MIMLNEVKGMVDYLRHFSTMEMKTREMALCPYCEHPAVQAPGKAAFYTVGAEDLQAFAFGSMPAVIRKNWGDLDFSQDELMETQLVIEQTESGEFYAVNKEALPELAKLIKCQGTALLIPQSLFLRNLQYAGAFLQTAATMPQSLRFVVKDKGEAVAIVKDSYTSLFTVSDEELYSFFRKLFSIDWEKTNFSVGAGMTCELKTRVGNDGFVFRHTVQPDQPCLLQKVVYFSDSWDEYAIDEEVAVSHSASSWPQDMEAVYDCIDAFKTVGLIPFSVAEEDLPFFVERAVTNDFGKKKKAEAVTACSFFAGDRNFVPGIGVLLGVLLKNIDSTYHIDMVRKRLGQMLF